VIKAILACDDTGGVSKDGTLPWPNNSTDLKWFKENTAGHVVVMGSTTWEDPHMPRPLPNRTNVLVTTRKKDFPGADGYISGNLNEELKKLEEMCPGLIIWAIGGPNMIEQCLGSIDEFYLSRIPGDYNCDTHLPLKKIETLFKVKWEEDHPEVKFQILEKR
jgi:dihydrofolate reductase